MRGIDSETCPVPQAELVGTFMKVDLARITNTLPQRHGALIF
jgi:hypothetical protein